MKASEELREKMWELCYDLLPDDERRALVATIKSDPQAARLYAEVRLQADLVGYASIVEDSSLILSPEGKNSPETEHAPAAGRSKEVLQPMPASSKVAAKSATKAHPSDTGKTPWVAWLPAVAALCLMALIGYGTLRPNVGPHQLTEALVTEVEVPGLLPAGVSQQIQVRSLHANGNPAPAELDVKLVAPDGEVRHHQIVQANEDGLATVDLPGQAVARGVRIEASARKESLARDHYERSAGEASDLMSVVSAPLPVATEPPLTYFLQESPNPQPGEPMRYAMYSLSRFGFEIQPADGREKERSVKQLGERDSAAGAQRASGMPAGGPTTRMKRSLADGVVEWTAEGDAKSLEEKLALETRDARLPEAISLAQERTTTLAGQTEPSQPSTSQPSTSQPNASKPSADRPNPSPAVGAGSGIDRTYADGIEKQSDASKLAPNFYRESTRRNYSARRNVQLLDSLASSSGSSPSGKSEPMKDAAEREALSELEAAKGGAIAAKQEADDIESKKALQMQRFTEESSEASRVKGEDKAQEAKEEDKGFAGALAQVDSLAPAPAGKPPSGFALFDAMREEPSVVAAGAPVTIVVPSELAERKLLLEARCRDVTVARAAMNPAKKDQSEKAQIALEEKPGGEAPLAKNESEIARQVQGSTWEFALQLPPEVDGDVQVRLIDTSVSPPQVVARQWFYRQPAKELKLALVAVNGLAEAKNEFKPGEKVSLRFRVLSEHDQPEVALLPVRVWREDAIEASGQEPEMLADFVRSQAALVASSDFGNSDVKNHAARGLSRLRGFDDSLNRALAMQSAQQTTDLKKADGTLAKARAIAPSTTPSLGAAVPGASPEATTASPPAPAPVEAPTRARSDAQPPAPAAPAPAAPEVVPSAPAAEAAAAGNLAYGVPGLPAAPLSIEGATTPVESAELYAMSLDSFAEAVVELPQQPQVVSNRHEVDRQQELAARESAAAWEAWRAVVGRVLVIGGLAALAGLFVLFLLRTPVRAGGGTLALVGGVASLLVGAFWIADGRQEMQIAFAPAESAPLAMSPAPSSAPLEADEAAEFSGQGMGGGGGEAMSTFGSTATMDDVPAAAPTNDESQQQNATGSALEGAPAGPDSAAPDRNNLNNADRFGKEANKEAEAASKSGEGFGGFGSGRSSRAAGMGGGGMGGARGSLRSKEPAPADAATEKPTTDQAAGAKAAGDRKSEDQQASEGARPVDAAENRGGKIASPPAQPRLAAETPKAAAVNAPGGGGRAVGDAGVPADDFPLPPAPAPGAAGQQPRTSEGEETVGRRRRGGVNDAPVTLYFNPRLETDADGYATIELQMPDAEADYRILIDAIGHGRIGSAEMLIMCRK